MASPQFMHGARAKVGIVKAGKVSIIGTIHACDYGVDYRVLPAFVLGRHGPAELNYVSMEPISGQMAGFRPFKKGPHFLNGVPALQDLLLFEDIVLTVIDRQAEALGDATPRMATIVGVKPTGYHVTNQAQNMTQQTLPFVGLLVHDEFVTMAEHPTAAQLP
jgi:hypothetical protein